MERKEIYIKGRRTDLERIELIRLRAENRRTYMHKEKRRRDDNKMQNKAKKKVKNPISIYHEREGKQGGRIL